MKLQRRIGKQQDTYNDTLKTFVKHEKSLFVPQKYNQ